MKNNGNNITKKSIEKNLGTTRFNWTILEYIGRTPGRIVYRIQCSCGAYRISYDIYHLDRLSCWKCKDTKKQQDIQKEYK